MQKEEYLIKNACYSVTKYYLCKRNNKRSLSGRKQRLEVVRSFPNRYQFSCINKVTSLFSNRYIVIIILPCNAHRICRQGNTCSPAIRYVFNRDTICIRQGLKQDYSLAQNLKTSKRITHTMGN